MPSSTTVAPAADSFFADVIAVFSVTLSFVLSSAALLGTDFFAFAFSLAEEAVEAGICWLFDRFLTAPVTSYLAVRLLSRLSEIVTAGPASAVVAVLPFFFASCADFF